MFNDPSVHWQVFTGLCALHGRNPSRNASVTLQSDNPRPNYLFFPKTSHCLVWCNNGEFWFIVNYTWVVSKKGKTGLWKAGSLDPSADSQPSKQCVICLVFNTIVCPSASFLLHQSASMGRCGFHDPISSAITDNNGLIFCCITAIHYHLMITHCSTCRLYIALDNQKGEYEPR